MADRILMGRFRLLPRALLALSLLCAAAPARADDDETDEWTILCISFKGPDRMQRAASAAESLKKVRGLRAANVSVQDADGAAVVYYGKYRKSAGLFSKEKKFRPDPTDDLTLIRDLSIQMPDSGQIVWPFRLAALVTLPPPVRFPQWELSKAEGRYSLQVGVFYNTETFKRRRYAAEEYCKVLRDEGQEAWFHHGPESSSVCIGSFPQRAIENIREKDPFTGRVRFTNRITDERMLTLQKKYPHNVHNGAVFYEVQRDPASGREVKTPHYSFPVVIPGSEDEEDLGDFPG